MASFLDVRKGRHSKVNLCFIYQPEDDPYCPVKIVAQVCGNLQVNYRNSSGHYTGVEYSDINLDEETWWISIPRNAITLNMARNYTVRAINLSPNSLTYGYEFRPIGLGVGGWTDNTEDSCWLQMLTRKEPCSGNCEEIEWCGESCDFCNGFSITYSEQFGTLMDFINQQTPGTTILVPNGTYDAGEILVNWLTIIPEDSENPASINGMFTTELEANVGNFIFL